MSSHSARRTPRPGQALLTDALLLVLGVFTVGGCGSKPASKPSAAKQAEKKVAKAEPKKEEEPQPTSFLQLDKQQTKIAPNSIGMLLSRIPAGKFKMGASEFESNTAEDEYPQHEVAFAKPFDIGVREVTVGQFKLFVDATGYKTEAESDGKGGTIFNDKGKPEQKSDITWKAPGFEQTDEHPVVQVSWNDAVKFCEWLSKKENAEYRLPTEAEWEYACRAENPANPINTAWTFGEQHHEMDEHAWYAYNSESRPSPGGLKKANAFGLHDVHGNVWEWVDDRFDPKYYEMSNTNDPPGPGRGPQRVMRGGAWNEEPRDLRSARRGHANPSSRASNIGFRVRRKASG